MNTLGNKLNNTSTGAGTLSHERVSPGVRDLFNRYYADYRPNHFFDLLLGHVRSGDHVLEIGAGSGQNKQNHFKLKNRVARYVGIDPDPSVLSYPYLHEGRQARAESLPFADATFDVVFHNYVAEHFESPGVCNREISRVLKPGGLLLFQTPNRYYYASLAAQVSPHWFHASFVSRLASGRSGNEVFPTFYRLNDASAIRKHLKDTGFAPADRVPFLATGISPLQPRYVSSRSHLRAHPRKSFPFPAWKTHRNCPQANFAVRLEYRIIYGTTEEETCARPITDKPAH